MFIKILNFEKHYLYLNTKNTMHYHGYNNNYNIVYITIIIVFKILTV